MASPIGRLVTSGATFEEPRLNALRANAAALADAEQGISQRAYHKSSLRFYGLRNAQMREVVRGAFPRAKGRDEYLPIVRELWQSPWFEERSMALLLLESLARELEPGDLSWLEGMTRDCEGWAHLDDLAVHVLGPLALAHGSPVYRAMRTWTTDDWMWTRRASVLVHILGGRKKKLDHDTAWPTFEELLQEKEFFIRKAIGWTLRELSKCYPQEVHDFLARVGDRASGLTRREGARKLPDELRIAILGK